ncbi:tRNA-ribosyltransferase family protein [Aspergillus clavatus NRRL 1]|uniref:Queuine tRNA-ribosyltransferase accessory subunit 2 n=1 Tax=Aspergillus clavatus (strain ATCC 1007 / CBS 513.65 / DSM 816 / NCTC 3887 / NRRL 1 / QM 1276 / 107) TaxID=344612 RepID=A1C4Z2_ASPCL|nr:tRNA-guanine transglycosylase family protein [Aspergillus clavatus NRRL 1]EAW14760.1 tRNA-guanine transglycosylase family protein [Aspergillus clavatus NRRL 1]
MSCSEMPSQSTDEMVHFTLLSPAAAPILAPRLGKLAIAGRKAISTPNYIPLTSRGSVPHVAHDVMREQTAIGSLFIGLEDCRSVIEKQGQPGPHRKGAPPIYNVPTAPNESALRKFISLPEDFVLILGPRRIPSIVCPSTNTPNSISVLTSVGFRQLEAGQYVEAVQKLRPDIVVGLADLAQGQAPGLKRRVKMADRTHAFTSHATGSLYGGTITEEARLKAAYFAPVLPLENTQQSLYLSDLEQELRPYISGLALYESASLSILPENLGNLPRLLFSGPVTPHDILREVSLGGDLFTVPFVGIASDAGIALDFTFPSASPTAASDVNPRELQPLAFDLWSSSHKTDTSPLKAACDCYTCTHHHRAYIHHLLSAKEMLAWTLLQIHNHHTMDTFFAAIRESIQRGTFEADIETFTRTYAPEFPERTGEGPRLRGHQLPAAGPNQPRRFPRVYGRLDDAAEKFAESQSSVATPDTGADGLEAHGFAQKDLP